MTIQESTITDVHWESRSASVPAYELSASFKPGDRTTAGLTSDAVTAG